MNKSRKNSPKKEWDKDFKKTLLFSELKEIITREAKEKSIDLTEEDFDILEKYFSEFIVTTRGSQLKKLGKVDNSFGEMWKSVKFDQRKNILTLLTSVRRSIFLELENPEDPSSIPSLLVEFSTHFFKNSMQSWTHSSWCSFCEKKREL
jgi:hypothetical protein